MFSSSHKSQIHTASYFLEPTQVSTVSCRNTAFSNHNSTSRPKQRRLSGTGHFLTCEMCYKLGTKGLL